MAEDLMKQDGLQPLLLLNNKDECKKEEKKSSFLVGRRK